MDHDLIARIEEKAQKTLRKIKKKKLPTFVNFKIYLTRLLPENFYGTAKLQKLPNNGTVDQLLLRPIIFNTEASTYDLAKYLNQQLKPLSHRNILSRMVNH